MKRQKKEIYKCVDRKKRTKEMKIKQRDTRLQITI